MSLDNYKNLLEPFQFTLNNLQSPPSLPAMQALSGLNQDSPAQSGTLEIPAWNSANQPEMIDDDNSPLYLENVPMKLSPNNPYLAYFPKKGSGMSATRKLIAQAMDWENKEAIRRDELSRQDGVKRDAELNQNRLAAIALEMLTNAASNPDVMANNRDIFKQYNTILGSQGGDQFAPGIIQNLLGLAGKQSNQPPEISPLDQARINEINANIDYKRKQTALLGLDAEKNITDQRLKEYNTAYNLYLKNNGGRWNPLANDGEGKWEFPSGFQPLTQVEFIRQSFPNGEAAAKDYIQRLTGMQLPNQQYSSSKSKKPIYRPNKNYNVAVWNDAEVISNTYGGPGKALIFLATQRNAKPTDPLFLALVDRYNQNFRNKKGYKPYTPQQFYAKFISNPQGQKDPNYYASK